MPRGPLLVLLVVSVSAALVLLSGPAAGLPSDGSVFSVTDPAAGLYRMHPALVQGSAQ